MHTVSITRVPSSRATIAAGTMPPRVMQITASKGPEDASRHASARASRWNWSHDTGKTFGGGGAELVLTNPIASDLDCMRPSILPNLIEAAGRNARRGFPDVALFEIGPIYRNDRPEGQVATISAVIAPHASRSWAGAGADALFSLKSDLMALLEELGAPALQVAQGQTSSWWHPGRSARLQLGPKLVVAEFGELHPSILKALDTDGPVYGFEINLDVLPEPKRKATKTRPALEASTLMPLSRDFAFVVAADTAAGDLVRAVAGADKALIQEVRVFDVYQGTGIPEGFKSVGIEVVLQPRDKTLTDVEIETLSGQVLKAAEKATGARLRT
jgi:phenylalanyl-tRNA synthetase beta chain